MREIQDVEQIDGLGAPMTAETFDDSSNSERRKPIGLGEFDFGLPRESRGYYDREESEWDKNNVPF